MIGTNWHSLTEISADETDEISAIVEIHPDSPWFSGHFPGNPILPGIAQLGMVSDLLKKTSPQQIKIDSIRRVRFKQTIQPDARIQIKIWPVKDKAHHYSFQIIVKDVAACKGMLVTQMINQEIKGNKPNMAVETNKLILRVAEVMIDELKLEDVTPPTFSPDIDLVDEVGIDSMDLATVALVLQDKYGIRIDEDDYPKLTTIRLIAEYLENKMQLNT